MDKMTDIKLVKQLTESRDQFNAEISKRIVGQQEIIDHILIALLCRGHTLLVGVPGLAKTLLIKSIACLLYTSPSPRDGLLSRMPSSA